MRILIFGASGMLGFALHRILHDAGWNTLGCVRSDIAPQSPWCRGLIYETCVEARDFGSFVRVIKTAAPDIVINAIGVNRPAVADTENNMLAVNAVLPRRLGLLAMEHGFKFVHFSTDGVYTGRIGNYPELALPDADDAYAVSKFLGEPCGSHSLVLRTSLVGRSLQGGHSLLDWLLKQKGTIEGFTQVKFSGLTVDEIASVIDGMLRRGPLPSGVYHLSGDTISKFELLKKLAAAWDVHGLEIRPTDRPASDRSLDSKRLRHLIGYEPPHWDTMIANSKAFYSGLEQKCAQI